MLALPLRILDARNFTRVTRQLLEKYAVDNGIDVHTLFVDRDVKFASSFKKYAEKNAIDLQFSFNLIHNPVSTLNKEPVPVISSLIFVAC